MNNPNSETERMTTVPSQFLLRDAGRRLATFIGKAYVIPLFSFLSAFPSKYWGDLWLKEMGFRLFPVSLSKSE